MRFKSKILAGVLATAMTGGAVIALAAGFFPNVPIVGGPQYCYNTVNGACQGYVPAGAPALTGSETVAADTGLASGQFPQTELVPTSVLGLPFGVNRLVGGDFDTNLGQRLSTTKGLATLAGITATAAVVSADGWWLYGKGTTNNTVTIASGSTEVLPALGSTHALRVARTSSATGALECVGQTLDQLQSAPLIGQNAVFSFYGLNGAGMSATGGAVTVEISYSSAAAAAATQSTLGYAGSQGSKYAIGTNATTFGSSGPTNQTAGAPVLVAGTSGTIGTNGFVTIPLSTTWARYAVATPIPANIPGTTTAVTDVSVQVCFTPTVATAITTDWFEVQGLQLEAKPSTVTPSLPSGVITPTAFERRPASIEAVIEYSYWYFNYENQSLVTTVASCENTSTSVANCLVVFPVPMRIVPAVSYTNGFQAFVQVAETGVGACTTLSAAASYAAVPSNTSVLVNCTATTVGAAGTANQLTTLGTSSSAGIISASALP